MKNVYTTHQKNIIQGKINVIHHSFLSDLEACLTFLWLSNLFLFIFMINSYSLHPYFRN